MANYDKSLDRMMYLMNFDNSLNESKKTNTGIECHRTGADGKEYGIIKEGLKYYIKTSTPEKQNIAESYEYIGGYNYRNQNGYNSYNEATKQLELKLIALNESYGKHEDVSIANLNKTKEAMSMLTESARKELNRMHSIFENSFISKDNIGNHGNPEGKGTATGSNTTKNNAPFEEKATATLDKDMKKTGTVDGATSDHKDVKDANSKLQNADKMERGNRGDEELKDTKSDLDGVSVAAEHKNGGKAVRVNESFMEEVNPDDYIGDDIDAQADQMDDNTESLGGEFDDEEFGGGEGMPAPELSSIEDFFADDEDDTDYEDQMNSSDELSNYEDNEENDIVGQPSLDEEIDNLLREFMDDPSVSALGESKEVEDGGEEGLKNFKRGGNGNNNVEGEETMDRIEEDVDVEGAGEKDSCITGPCNVLDHHTAKPGPNGVHGEKTMDKMDETIRSIANMVYESICDDKKKCPKCGKKKCECNKKECECNKKETLEEAVARIMKEEVTKLNVWGKHPKFRKSPMTLPDNKEVLAGTAEKDWNDDSAKGQQPYGLKIGKSDPFVEVLTDQILANIKESLNLGK